jgi:aspartate/methionine/tyrosine aminotransferase
MIRTAHRTSNIIESATLALEAEAKRLRAAGRPVISFAAGEPNFATPEHIVRAAAAACPEERLHHYGPTAGLPELRAAVAERAAASSGHRLESDSVLVTNGAKQAVHLALMALVDPGDDVLLPAPYWTTYPEAIRIAGARAVAVPADAATNFLVTVDQLEAARTPRTRLVVLCSPSNPTGGVYERKQLELIGEWALAHGVWVLSDEIYEHLVYDGAECFTPAAVVPELIDQTVVVNGVAKAYAMPGWRVGWLVGPPAAVSAATVLQSHTTSHVCHVAQAAAVAALRCGSAAIATMQSVFDRRRRRLVEALNALPGVNCPVPKGAFFAFPSVVELLGRRVGGQVVSTSAELAALLLERAEVAVVPGEAFGNPGHLRFSYALGDDDLAEGVARISRLLAS